MFPCFGRGGLIMRASAKILRRPFSRFGARIFLTWRKKPLSEIKDVSRRGKNPSLFEIVEMTLLSMPNCLSVPLYPISFSLFSFSFLLFFSIRTGFMGTMSHWVCLVFCQCSLKTENERNERKKKWGKSRKRMRRKIHDVKVVKRCERPMKAA